MEFWCVYVCVVGTTLQQTPFMVCVIHGHAYTWRRPVLQSLLSCSIPELLQSCQPQLLAGKLRTAPADSDQSTIWQYVANAPHLCSNCATLCGQLVVVGGEGGHGATKGTSTIVGYNETTDSWVSHGRHANCSTPGTSSHRQWEDDGGRRLCWKRRLLLVGCN